MKPCTDENMSFHCPAGWRLLYSDPKFSSYNLKTADGTEVSIRLLDEETAVRLQDTMLHAPMPSLRERKVLPSTFGPYRGTMVEIRSFDRSGKFVGKGVSFLEGKSLGCRLKVDIYSNNDFDVQEFAPFVRTVVVRRRDRGIIVGEQMSAMDGSTYLVADGGPHIVLPDAVRGQWHGMPADSSNVFDPASDYGRACEVAEEIGLIAVGESHALVLAGSPPMSTCVEVPGKAGLDIIRIEAWSDITIDDLVQRAQSELATHKLADTGVTWHVPVGGITLMFASDVPGHAIYGELHYGVRSGTYRIFAQTYAPTPTDILTVYRLVEAGGSGAR